jgi:hypothetical protein
VNTGMRYQDTKHCQKIPFSDQAADMQPWQQRARTTIVDSHHNVLDLAVRFRRWEGATETCDGSAGCSASSLPGMSRHSFAAGSGESASALPSSCRGISTSRGKDIVHLRCSINIERLAQ